MTALRQGDVIADRYVLDRRLGAGGFGEVWSADDSGEAVALKFLHPHLRSTADAPLRFRREILTTARLSHPAIVPVLDAGQTPGGHLWFAMEFVEGKPIDAVWGSDLSATLQLFDRLLAVLAHAHARGVIHRDLKPDNVLVDAMGELRLLDFGVAAVDPALTGFTGADPSITNPGMALGTAAYMSPEQSSGAADTCGPPSDLYSVGVMLFEFLTGRVPFTGTWIEVMAGHTLKAPPTIEPREGLFQNLPTDVASWVHSLLAKRYDQRPETAAAARAGLADICARIGVATGRSAAVVRGERATTLIAARTPRGSGTVSDGPESQTGPATALDIAQAREMPPLGRGRELDALRCAIASPGITVVAGAAGVGRRHLVRHLVYDLLERGASRVLRVHIGGAGTEAAVHGALVRALRPRRLERKWLLPCLRDDWQLPPELAEDLCQFLSRGPAHTATLPAFAAGRLAATWRDTINVLAAQPTPAPLLVWVDGEDTSGNLLQCVADLRQTLPVIWTHPGERREQLLLQVEAGRGVGAGPGIRGQAPGTRVTVPAASPGFRLPPIDDDDVRDMVCTLAPDASADIVAELVTSSAGLPSLARRRTLDWLQSGTLPGVDAAAERVHRFGEDDRLDALGLLAGPFPQQLVSAAFGGEVAVMFRALHGGLLEADPDGDGELRFTEPRVAALLRERATAATAQLAMELVERTAMDALLAGDWPVGERCLGLAWTALPWAQRPTMLRLGCLLAHRRRDAEVLAHRAAQWNEARAERALWSALATALENPSAGLAALENIPSQVGEFDARLALARAQCAGLAGQLERAADAAHRAIGLAIELPDSRWNRLLRADVFSVLAESLVQAGRIGAARTQLRLLLGEFESLGDIQGQAQVHLRLARIARREGNDPEPSLARARKLLLGIDDRRSLAIAAWEAGAASLGLGQLTAAEAKFRAAADLFASVGDTAGAATCGNARGEVARKAGRFDDARRHYGAFAAAMDELGHADGSAWARLNLGWTALADGRPAQARAHFDLGCQYAAPGTAAATAGRLGAALSALRAGHPQEARRLSEGIDDTDDDDAKAALQELRGC